MSKRKIAWSMFTKHKGKTGKEEKMATSDNSDIMEKLWGKPTASALGSALGSGYGSAASAMQAEMDKYRQQQEAYRQAQQAQQAANIYGSNTVSQYPNIVGTTTTATTAGNWTQVPYGTMSVTPTPVVEDVNRQLLTLQIINLISECGPTVAKKIINRFHINISAEEVDQIHKDLAKAIASDDDMELDRVINDVAKEVNYNGY